ncbi:class I SAM-dependent DNA methyltransferase [Silvibacterium bohemicum]|uniref:class I SAM-dependent DNA methyltransferase n=1 Tax=Silvibacterium bohemicum TaxID=1577686 RepID=UPI0006787F07|nr:DNA methyltransferase [Silvibacterium bohemicum]
MNAVEIEEAISQLADQAFDSANFPYAFLEAFGNKETTIKRLRAGASNKSDLGGVLQTNNIHIATCGNGQVTKTLTALKDSPSTAKAKAKFILATDGTDFEAEELGSGETVACAYRDFPDKFGFFLPLAGITTVRQIAENSFDIRATSRLNRLYVELLKDNPEWGTAERRHDMNHFMARLIFCFFAEDTDIFIGKGLFTDTIAQMSAKDSSNTHEVVGALFRAMNTRVADRDSAGLPRWANTFPYVNGGLFSGNMDAPRFTKIARSYLLHIGNLDWTKINPDIFGSMIQAVAEDEERGALGMHYTSVPNILKVLNPLFLDDLRAQLAEAGENSRALLNLRKRMAKIRVFDPACGSGNFLVIAYKEMRAIEAQINRRRGEPDLRSEIPLTNFRGIELRDFPAEIARLALVIAEYQGDVLYRGQKLALTEFLPLRADNWITCGNALRLDWLSICPPTGVGVKLQADDLFSTPLDQAQIDFENEGGETYICGNPPYKGGTKQNDEQKSDIETVFSPHSNAFKSLDYVSGWFFRFSQYAQHAPASCAFVSTNSIAQGEQVARLWPLIFDRGQEILFAHTSFKWANLASHNAGVTVVIIGLGIKAGRKAVLFENAAGAAPLRREVENISPYLVPFKNLVIEPRSTAISDVAEMVNGSKPADGGNLLFGLDEAQKLRRSDSSANEFIYQYVGASEAIDGALRYCLWIDAENKERALRIEKIAVRVSLVKEMRAKSTKKLTNEGTKTPWAFQQVRQTGREAVLVVPSASSESREYLPIGLLPPGAILSNAAFGFFDAPIWNFALIASRMHLVWIAAVCGRIKTDYRYSSTLGWNTFPVPTLTDKNKADLTRCAEDILLAREEHFPATIADLYDPEKMPYDLHHAHERNDEVLERIYIGRRFKNDTERLEKLFDLYTKMTASAGATKKVKMGAPA